MFWRVASRPLVVRIGRVARRIWRAIAWSTGHEVEKSRRRNERLWTSCSVDEKTEEIGEPSAFLLAVAEADGDVGGERERWK